jgi:hypothetical protein
LRDDEIYNMQLLVERQLNNMANLTGQREEEGKAGKGTRKLVYRMTAIRKKIRDLMSAWVALHSLGDPAAQLPDYDEGNVLANILPWQPTSTSREGGISLRQLQLQLYQVESELARSGEELLFLPHDAMRCLLFYQRRITSLQAWLMRHGATIDGNNIGRLMLMHNALKRLEAVLSHALKVFVNCKWVSAV